MGTLAAEKLLEVRRIHSAQMILEWIPRIEGPPPPGATAPVLAEEERRAQAALSRRLQLEYPDEAVGLPAPFILRRRADGRTAELRPGGVTVNAGFTSNYQLKSDLAFDWISKHWRSFITDLNSAGTTVRGMALIIEVEMSTEGMEVDEREFVASFIKAPRSGRAADAEIRISWEEKERYFVNVGLSTYQQLEMTMDVRQGTGGATSISDRGVKSRIDVNTKVNVLRARGPIEISGMDFDEILKLSRNALDTELPQLLRGSP